MATPGPSPGFVPPMSFPVYPPARLPATVMQRGPSMPKQRVKSEQYTLKVTRLPPNVTREEMEGVCKGYVDYQSLKLNDGHAFVNFSSREGATRAMEHLKKCRFHGQCPLVKVHDKNPAIQVQRPSGGQMLQCHSLYPTTVPFFHPGVQERGATAIKVAIHGRGITGEDLEGCFSQFGKVLQVPFIISGHPDYAYVNFESSEEARAACQTHEMLLNGVQLSVKLKSPPSAEKGSKLISNEDDLLVNLILTTCAFKDIEGKLSNVSTKPSKDGRGVHISGDKDKVEMAENIIRLHMKLLQAQIVSESINLHCQFIPLFKDPQVFQSIEQEHGVEFSIKLADSSTKSIAALSSTVAASVSPDTYPLTIESISEYLCDSGTGPVTWKFYENDGQFTLMSATDTDAIEKLYQQCHQHSQIFQPCYTIGKWKYCYDFENMIQENTSTGTEREIQRIPAPESLSLCLSCRGLQDSVKASIASLQEKLESLVINKTLGCSADVLEPLTKLARSFCVKVDSVDDSIILSGGSEYLTKVSLILTEKRSNFKLSSIVSSFPPEWGPQVEDIELKTVQSSSIEWLKIVSAIKITMLEAKILKIERIQNKFLYAKYDLCKKRMNAKNKGMVNERRLFHGSSDVPPETIYKSEHGFDFRYGASGIFGRGAYFAVNASYSANSFAFGTPRGHRQIFMAFVLTGDSKVMSRGDRSLVAPPKKIDGVYDSVTGRSVSSEVSSEIYVVYDHDKCYPAYLITLQ